MTYNSETLCELSFSYYAYSRAFYAFLEANNFSTAGIDTFN